jgi:hypothetical protein
VTRTMTFHLSSVERARQVARDLEVLGWLTRAPKTDQDDEPVVLIRSVEDAEVDDVLTTMARHAPDARLGS